MPTKGANAVRGGHYKPTRGLSHLANLLSKSKYRTPKISTPVSSVTTPPDTVLSISQEQQLYAAATALIEGLQNLDTNQFNTSEAIASIEAVQLNQYSSTASLALVLEDLNLFSSTDFVGLLNSEGLQFVMELQ